MLCKGVNLIFSSHCKQDSADGAGWSVFSIGNMNNAFVGSLFSNYDTNSDSLIRVVQLNQKPPATDITGACQCFCFQNLVNYSLDTLILRMYSLTIEINNFWGALTDISAKIDALVSATLKLLEAHRFILFRNSKWRLKASFAYLLFLSISCCCWCL